MKTASNRVLVIGADRNRWKDRMVTEGGLELFLAPTSDVKTYDIKYWGYVVAVPDKLNGYRQNDTAVRVKPGDFVYFNYKTMMRPALLRLPLNELIETDNTEIVDVWECDYSEIFCRVDDKGEVHAIGDWVLLKKIEHTEQLGSGALINPFSEVRKGEAVVATISEGVTLNTADGPVAVGDTVLFTHDQGAFENEINGSTYWCCPADIIHAKV